MLPALLLTLGCARSAPAPPAPTPSVRLAVVGPAGPADSVAPRVSAAGGYVVVRGVAHLPAGAGLYGDLDLSDPPALRLTLYDSVSGRPLVAVPTSPPEGRAVVFEARVGPLSPGGYEVTVGRYDAASRLIVVEGPAQRVRVGKPGPGDSQALRHRGIAPSPRPRFPLAVTSYALHRQGVTALK
jgi:hypothetical protein